MTRAEEVLWNRLRKRQILNTKFRRQVSIGNYITDFFTFDVHLAIEVDGKDHDAKQKKEYDSERQEIIEGQNITVLRFKNEEVIDKIESVIKKIEEKITELRNAIPVNNS